jgi:FAD/FMN-containing dehydrogenase
MIHGSYGTLGILTQLSFQLVPAKPFVRLEHRMFESPQEFRAHLDERCRVGDFDFVDGIVHGPRQCVACLGRFVDGAPYVSDYRRGGGVFYASTLARTEDFLTTEGYCFRFDADCHWLTRTVPPLEWKPVRRLLGAVLLGSTNLIRWSKRLEPLLRLKKRPDVVCDVFIPGARFLDFFAWYQERFDFWPLWVVPYRMPTPYPWMSPQTVGTLSGRGEVAFDCAIYGKPNAGEVDLSEALEEKTWELGGVKTLIGRNHYARERFWQVYNSDNYREAKRRLDPQGAFPDLYEKFHRPAATARS